MVYRLTLATKNNEIVDSWLSEDRIGFVVSTLFGFARDGGVRSRRAAWESFVVSKNKDNSMVNYGPHALRCQGFKTGSRNYAKNPGLVMSRFVCHNIPRVRESEARRSSTPDVECDDEFLQ